MAWHKPTPIETLREIAGRLRYAEREDDLDTLHDLLSECAWDIDMAADEMADYSKPEETTTDGDTDED